MILLKNKKLKRKLKRFRINLYKFLHYKHTFLTCFLSFSYDMLREECLRSVVRENRRASNKLGKVLAKHKQANDTF